jgi:hypothetical protein
MPYTRRWAYSQPPRKKHNTRHIVRSGHQGWTTSYVFSLWQSVKSYSTCVGLGALEPRRVQGRRGPGASPQLRALAVDHPSPRERVVGRASRCIITVHVLFRGVSLFARLLPASPCAGFLNASLPFIASTSLACLLNHENGRRDFGTPSHLGVPFSPNFRFLSVFYFLLFLFEGGG